jgi:alpha-tubulin suppressor-like RCC1 family protein
MVLIILAGCDTPTFSSEPIPPQAFVAVATGSTHTCALRLDGTAWCWGEGATGQLGTGRSRPEGVPARVMGNETFVALAAGQQHTCGLTDQGAVFCWGWNQYRQLGDGTGFTHNIPTQVSSTLRFTAVVAGIHHSCALAVDGTAWCWGASGQGRLGTPQGGDLSVPTAVQGNHRFTAITAGGFHSCGVRSDRRVLCWGMNHAGQLGDGTVEDRNTPVLVEGALQFQSVDAGYSHTCAVTPQRAIYCWGERARGALGDRTDGPAGAGTTVPSPLFSTQSFDRVSAGLHYACGVDRSRRIHCWGAGTEGQLGDPRLRDWSTAQLVTTPDQVRFATVSTSFGGHTCALTLGAALYCWGQGPRGELGAATTTFSPTPVRVQTPS